MFFKEFNHFFRDPVPDDSSSGTSDFNKDNEIHEPDDCYCEAYDAVTGKEIPIDHAYTMDEMKKRTFTDDDLDKIRSKEELNAFYTELKSKLGQVETDVASIKGWRVTYQGIGIYEALKNAMFEQTGSPVAWMTFINSDACNWLPKPPSYGNNNKSFFTEKGFNRFNKLVLPIISQYIDRTKIYIEEIMVPTNQIVYSDEFQFVTSGIIQESKMPAKKRNSLDNKDFGLVYKDANGKTIRKYPLNDKAHVASAARLFGHCPDKYKKRLANKILRKAHEFGMDTSGWDTVNKAAKQ